MSEPRHGRLIGVGTGPGDPELMTLKAVRALSEADVVAWFAKRGNHGHGRAIAAPHIRQNTMELPLLYPVTTEIEKTHADYETAITGFYEDSARAVETHLVAGRTVAVLSEGDPLFYGSYMHLHVRLASRYAAEVIPGITAMSGCWSQAGLPLVQGDDVLTVLPGTLGEDELARRLGDGEGFVIMKVGRNLPKIRRALARTGKLGRAVYVERGTMEGTQTIALGDKADDRAPYFSLVLVPGWASSRSLLSASHSPGTYPPPRREQEDGAGPGPSSPPERGARRTGETEISPRNSAERSEAARGFDRSFSTLLR